MQKTVVKLLATLGLAAVALVSTPARADASFQAWICDTQFCFGGDAFVVDDNSALDNDPAAGSIAFVHATGGLTTVVNVSQSKPILPQPSMDLNFVASGVGTAYLYAADTDFTAVSSLKGSLDGNWSGNGTIEGILYGGDNNAQGTLSSPVSTGLISTSPFSAQIFKAAATTSPVLTVGGRGNHPDVGRHHDRRLPHHPGTGDDGPLRPGAVRSRWRRAPPLLAVVRPEFAFPGRAPLTGWRGLFASEQWIKVAIVADFSAGRYFRPSRLADLAPLPAGRLPAADWLGACLFSRETPLALHERQPYLLQCPGIQ